MLDLHMHSNCSDGTDTPTELLRKCEQHGIEYVSITDHDNCNAYNDVANWDKVFSGKIITGIELQAYFKGLSIEILGYGFNVAKMQKLTKDLYLPFDVVNNEELKRLYDICKNIGMTFEYDVIEKYQKSGIYYATEYLHNEIKKSKYNRQFIPDNESLRLESIFFKRHISNPNSLFYINESDLIPSAKKIIEIIHNAGGLAFIAHVFQYEENALDVLSGLADFVDGVECFYSSFKNEQTEFLLKFCNGKELFVSGGSDYHGSKRPEISLGSKVPKEYVDKWYSCSRSLV
ncbi:phosphatase [Endomicrobiia bacterium]|nr:phosphatase [Endomicrobiia bacterium]